MYSIDRNFFFGDITTCGDAPYPFHVVHTVPANSQEQDILNILAGAAME